MYHGGVAESNPTVRLDSRRVVVVRVSVAIHRAMRLCVAKEDTSIQQWVVRLIEQELERSNDAREKKSNRG